MARATHAIVGIIAVLGTTIGTFGLFPVVLALSSLPTIVAVLSTGAGTASTLALAALVKRRISRVLLLSALILVLAIILGFFAITVDQESLRLGAQIAEVVAVAYLALAVVLALLLDRRRNMNAAGAY